MAEFATAINGLEHRFTGIQSAQDCITTDEGLDQLDSIAMMLFWMGERIKWVDLPEAARSLLLAAIAP